MARQRIIPAIPHQLTIRRAKVVPAGKSDQQTADDKGKSTPLSTSADKLNVSTRTAGIEGANARQRDERAVVLNGDKDEQARQMAVEEEPVAVIKELAVNKEPLEEKQVVENKEELSAKKEVIEEKKEVNGESYLPHVDIIQDAK